MESSPSSHYAHLLEKTRLPHPAFQRRAVVSIFDKLRSSPPAFGGLDSDPGRDALSRCLSSPSPAVVDQAVRELCRLVKAGRLDAPRGLIELQSALEGCDAVFLPVFVKGIGFLCRLAFRDDPSWRKRQCDSPGLHPFVKVLSCRTEACDELMLQVLSFMVHNRDAGAELECEFLRPLLTFAILKMPSSAQLSVFVISLMSSIAALSCSFPADAIPIIRFLMGCLKFFSCRDHKDIKFLLCCAECLVDMCIEVLKQSVGTETLMSQAKACFVDLLETLLLDPLDCHRHSGGSDAVIRLTKRLLVAYKELGLDYASEFIIVTLFSSVALTQVEFEHVQLSILKLLIFVVEWKNEIHQSEGNVSLFIQEFLIIFPLMNLLSSPTKSVKATATYLLSILERFLLYSLAALKKVESCHLEVASVSRPASIFSRILHHVWFQEQSFQCSLHILHLTSAKNSMVVSEDKNLAPWISELREYSLSTVEKLKTMHTSQSRDSLLSGMPMMLCAVVTVLVTHPILGCSSVDSLSALGHLDPRVSMPLLLTVLFYIKVFCRSGRNAQEVLLRLLKILPSLASNSHMVSLVLQTVLPMLHKNAKPVLYATAVRLLCKTWMVTDRCFGSLQEALESKEISQCTSERDISTSFAASVCDVCKHSPDRGIDLILSVSSCIESQDSSVQALGLESLSHLCEADVVDFYTAWDVISKNILNYSSDPIIAHRLCMLLKWGAVDVDAYPKESENVLQILWDIGTTRNTQSGSKWLKARAAAFQSFVHYDIGHVSRCITNFKERNLEFLISEDNDEVLRVLEQFEIKIIMFDHMTRRRLLKEKRSRVHKVEKLLGLFPQAMFPLGEYDNYARDLPGAALLSHTFTPKEFQNKGTSKELHKLHAIYESKLVEIAESLQLSRNILLALLALQSWKAFISRWIKASSMLVDPTSNLVDGNSKIANDILKIMCKAAEASIPRAAENIALAIGALCMVLRSSMHSVASAALNFLLKWLWQYEHEYRQWPAAISLGLASNCLHATDRTLKYNVIAELLKVLRDSESFLVKGACGIGLGFSSQDLLTRVEVEQCSSLRGITKQTESSLLGKIVRSLCVAMRVIYPSLSDSIANLFEKFPPGIGEASSEEAAYLQHGNSDNLKHEVEDVWGIAGLVIGLGHTADAVYRTGAHAAVLEIKDFLLSLIPFLNSFLSSCQLFDEVSMGSLALGSCIALPTVVALCERNELMHSGTDDILRGYSDLISDLLATTKPGIVHHNLVMASCMGAGSLLSYILNNGAESLKIDDVKRVLEVMRSAYSCSNLPIVLFGGMLGIVNAFGAGAGHLISTFSQPSSFQSNRIQKESEYVSGPMLANSELEPFSTSIVQEMFILAKDTKDKQIKKYAAWAVSFLWHGWWLKGSHNAIDTKPVSHSFSDDSLVWNLFLWLLDIQSCETGATAHVNTIATILRCLKEAPRLPVSSDWGPIIRRCMRHAALFSSKPLMDQFCKVLREECINLSLVHANHIEQLLLFLDDITDISRFSMLEKNLQLSLLTQLSKLEKVFSATRLEKLYGDLIEYFSSPTSLYWVCEPHQQCLMRISFWRGLYQCLAAPSDSSTRFSNVEKCMGMLFCQLPVLILEDSYTGDQSGINEEWSEAIRCLANSRTTWLMHLLEFADTELETVGSLTAKVTKGILTRARLVIKGHISISELGKLKGYFLNARSEGVWSVLIEVAAAVLLAEESIKRQWFLDVVDVGIISQYPSTVLRFIGILSSCHCKYKPLLIIDPITVLRDLPVTLPSLLSEGGWSTIRATMAMKLWLLTERIGNWATHLQSGGELPITDYIDTSENHFSVFLSSVMLHTCISLKEYLPFDNQLRLANMPVHSATISRFL